MKAAQTFVAAFAACISLVAAPAFAQPVQPAPAPAPAAPAATLDVMNRTVMTFRAPYLGFSPEERASQSHGRLEVALRKGGPGRVATQPTESAIGVSVDGALAFAVTPGDADVTAGLSQEATAKRAADDLQRAIDESHEARDFDTLAKAAAFAALGTIIFVAMIGLLHRARTFALRHLAMRARAHAARLNVAGVQVFEGSRLIQFQRYLLSAAYWTLVLVLAYEWAGRTLELFPFTRPWGERINDFLLATTIGMLEAITRAVPSLLVAIVIFFIARFVIGMLRRFFDRVEAANVDLGWINADTARPTRRIATVAVWLLALVMAYPYLPGANSEAFKGMSVLVGLMVSLGGASVVGQALSGLILMYTRTFRVGEYVRVGEHEGTVVEVGMYQTRIRTGLGDELYLPNALVLQSVTRNYSRDASGGFVMQASVSIGYDVAWRQVHAMLQEAARRTHGVLARPEPRVLQVALSDFYIEYRLVAHSDPADPTKRAEAHSRLHENILDVFNENGVQILSPHYFSDPDHEKVVPKARWYEAPAKKPD